MGHRHGNILASTLLLFGSASLLLSACAPQADPAPPVQQDPPLPVAQAAPAVTPAAPSSPIRTEGGSITKQTTQEASAAPPLSQLPNSVTVDMVGSAFTPLTVTVAAGGRVTWINKDIIGHTVTSQIDLFDSGNLAKGEEFSYVFNQPGTFAIICDYHPLMRGTVIVK